MEKTIKVNDSNVVTQGFDPAQVLYIYLRALPLTHSLTDEQRKENLFMQQLAEQLVGKAKGRIEE